MGICLPKALWLGEKIQGPLQGSKAGHTGIPQAVKVKHPGHRKLVKRWLVTSILREVAR